METLLITGANGFIGRRVVEKLAAEGTFTLSAVVRQQSTHAFAEYLAGIRGGEKVTILTGDITAPGLGLEPSAPAQFDHVLHLAAIYDMEASDAAQQHVNVEGTRHVAEFAKVSNAVLHHVSSIAVSGDHRGVFTEEHFDEGQSLPTPYHRTKFESEKAVRDTSGLRWRVYRPAVVVGDSKTGRMDKVDGPYYFFEQLALLGMLPSWLPVPFPNMGRTNIVPVDFVSDAICTLMPLNPEVDHAVYHLSDPVAPSITDMYNAFAPAFGGPKGFNALPNSIVQPVVFRARRGALRRVRDAVARGQNIPPAVLDGVAFTADFRADATASTLAEHGVHLPALATYAPTLWDYWETELDTRGNRHRDRRGRIVGEKILITGGSSGIGKATAKMCLERGADAIIVARSQAQLDEAVIELRQSIPKPGLTLGQVNAYVCDITDEDAVRELISTVIADHGHVDVLVNNAGHSIRREAMNAVNRAHDYRRLMDVNYFGAVYLTLALLPHMRDRRTGHIVNVTSIAVAGRGPRFSAYTASKSALEAFADVVATETRSLHITFSNVRLPLTQTPMIEPSGVYARTPGVWSPEKAASRVLRAIEKRPPRVDTAEGFLGGMGRSYFPRISGWMMHQMYLASTESRAARGIEARAIVREPATPLVKESAAPR